MTFIQTDAAEFAQRFGATWETQFKFLPCTSAPGNPLNRDHRSMSLI